MQVIDEFGKDPAVQRTRKLFSMMEKMDRALLQSANLSPFDERLRAARDLRLYLYEKSFSLAAIKRICMDEASLLELFSHCQKIAFKKFGISYTPEYPETPEITSLIREVSA